MGVLGSEEKKSRPFAFVVRQELQVVIPFVADDFAAGETANRYNLWS